jgi:CspA family cold shock protein
MASGTVKWSDPNRGYGFIRPEQGEDVFVHVSAMQTSGLQTLQEGQAVEFDIEQGGRGLQAANFSGFASQPMPPEPACGSGPALAW